MNTVPFSCDQSTHKLTEQTKLGFIAKHNKTDLTVHPGGYAVGRKTLSTGHSVNWSSVTVGKGGEQSCPALRGITGIYLITARINTPTSHTTVTITNASADITASHLPRQLGAPGLTDTGHLSSITSATPSHGELLEASPLSRNRLLLTLFYRLTGYNFSRFKQSAQVY